jgi:hypothetical protein
LDKTWQEYLADIANRTSSDYPVVVKVSDPLLIRFNEKSLVVNNTNFYTNIKSGLAFEGFYIYTSGLGIPIAEIGQAPKNKKDSRGNVVVDGQAAAELEKKAKEFLDVLEAKIATTENDNEIKKAIDRLCWQLHYDISKTDTTELPEGFYPDIQIDKKSTISDYCDTVSDRIANFSTDGGHVPDATLSCAMNKIAVNLRADPETVGDITYTEYTVSRALRDIHGDNELSVSGATKARTEVEETEFHEISVNQLGQFGTTHNHRTLYDAVGSYAESSNNSNISAELNKIGTSDNSQSNTLFYDIQHKAATATGTFSNDSPFGTINTSISNAVTTINANTNTTVGNAVTTIDGHTDTKVDSAVTSINAHTDTEISGAVNAINGHTDGATSDISSISGSVSNIESDVSSISGDVTDISDKIGNFGTPSLYDVLIGEYGAIKSAVGFRYAEDHVDPYYYVNNSSTPELYTKYYVDTELSRFGIPYNAQEDNRPNCDYSSQGAYGNPYSNALRSATQDTVP